MIQTYLLSSYTEIICKADKKIDFRNPPHNTDFVKTLWRFHRPDVVGDLQFGFIDCNFEISIIRNTGPWCKPEAGRRWPIFFLPLRLCIRDTEVPS